MNGLGATTIFIVGIAVIVFLTSKYKIQPFLVVFFVALAVGLLSGLPPEGMGNLVIEGFSNVLGYTVVIAVSALIIAEIMQKTGAVFVISKAVLSLFGKNKAQYAMGNIGYLVAYPVQCADTSFLMLSPLVQSLTSDSSSNAMTYILTLSAGAFASYTLLFPAAPLLPVTILKADIGSALLLGFISSIPTMFVGLFLANWLAKRNEVKIESKSLATLDEIEAQYEKLPSLTSVAAVIIIPTILIVGRSIVGSLLDGGSVPLFDFIGNPVIALPLGVLLSIALLARDRSLKEVNEWISEGVTRSASLLMIVGSGSVLAVILQKTGVGVFLGNLALGLHLPGLLVIFVIAALLKTAQGGTTVTMMTATSIIAPLVPTLGVNPTLAAMTICAGAMMLMHINDSFFWVVIGFSRMEVSTGYKTLTVIMAVMGIVAFMIIALIGPILLGH